MKYIFNFFTVLLLASLIIVSCKRKTDNNGTTNLSKGTYISGTATVFTSIGAAATFDEAKLDDYDGKSTGAGLLPTSSAGGKGITSDPTVLAKYVWLKTGGSFTITISDANKVNTVYGMGTATTPSTNTRFTTYNMVKDAAGFTVPTDGLYFLIVCTQNNQITIAPAKWGITLGSGSAEIPMVVTPYNATTNDVVYTLTTDILKSATFKFRYSGEWGIGKIPFTTTAGDSVTVHSDVASADGTLSNANYGSILSTLGKDMSVGATASYTVYFKYNVAKSVFSAYATNNGQTVKPAPPDYLYITGTNFAATGGNGVHTAPVIMQPGGNGSNAFWAIVYLDGNGTGTIKLSPTNSATDAKAFGMTGSAVILGTEQVYGRGTTNIPEPTGSTGYYMVTYKFVDAATKDSISIKPADVFLFGIAPPAYTGDNWTWADKTLPTPEKSDAFVQSGTGANTKFTSPTFNGAGTLRMAVYSRWIPQAWASEFTILGSGSQPITFRGSGGDLAWPSVTATGSVTLNFVTNTGTITP